MLAAYRPAASRAGRLAASQTDPKATAVEERNSRREGMSEGIPTTPVAEDALFGDVAAMFRT